MFWVQGFFKAPPVILMCTQSEEAVLRTMDMGDECSPFFHNNSKHKKKNKKTLALMSSKSSLDVMISSANLYINDI